MQLTRLKPQHKVPADQGETEVRIAVMGAGAVGGYFGARLRIGSHDVAFMARGSHLAALRREGLILESPQGKLQVRGALFTEDPEEVGIVDLVLFCVKSYDTESAAAKLKPLMGNGTIILSLQNGVDNADKIARRWREERTLAGVVYIGSQRLHPGTIRHVAHKIRARLHGGGSSGSPNPSH